VICQTPSIDDSAAVLAQPDMLIASPMASEIESQLCIVTSPALLSWILELQADPKFQ
jgi:hypothetical protein